MGCGGDDNLSEADATAKINALCRESASRTEQINLDPSSQSGEEFVAAYQAELSENTRLQDELEELQLGGESQPAADYVSAHGDAVETTKGAVETINGAQPGDVAPVRDALQGASDANKEAIAKADVAGLDDCGPHTQEIEAASSPVATRARKPRAAGNTLILPGSAFVGTWEGSRHPDRPRQEPDLQLSGLHADRPEAEG